MREDRQSKELTDIEYALAELEAEISAFLDKHDMSPSRFGREVANNTELLPRLRRGVSSIASLIKISDYMANYASPERHLKMSSKARDAAILKAVEELGLFKEI